MRTFHDFRNATEPVLALGHASGVITFPSFHVGCALVLAQAWHGFRIIGLLAKLLAGIIIFSCVPIGGHYLVDLAAGAAVWWGVTIAIDRAGRMQSANRPNSAIAMSTA
jgi:membrane-associated phospholipid phosphatase